jgi:hypothetical protein
MLQRSGGVVSGDAGSPQLNHDLNIAPGFPNLTRLA